jgi:hypothetical protein
MSTDHAGSDASDSRIIDGGTSVLPDVIEVRHGPWGLDERRTTYVAVDALRLEHREVADWWARDEKEDDHG